VRVDKGVLHCGAEAFHAGEAVVVVSELSAQAFPGTFIGANAVEAACELSDGTRCRLPLAHLRAGRLVVRKAAGARGGLEDLNVDPLLNRHASRERIQAATRAVQRAAMVATEIVRREQAARPVQHALEQRRQEEATRAEYVAQAEADAHVDTPVPEVSTPSTVAPRGVRRGRGAAPDRVMSIARLEEPEA